MLPALSSPRLSTECSTIPQKAIAAGYIKAGEHGTIRPDEPLDRLEALEILSRLKPSADFFIDPQGYLTRGEAVILLYKVRGEQAEDGYPSGTAALEEGKVLTLKGYITTENDFVHNLGEDTAGMVYMRMMAQSGLGLTFQVDGKWVFYYFDGEFASYPENGTFNGTGSQRTAWNIVGEAVKNGGADKSVPVTVTGILKGDTRTNPGEDADGIHFKVITVESMTKNDE